MKEIWKCIKNYDDYKISNFGRVKSFYNNDCKLLKTPKQHDYKCVCLSKKGINKTFSIHHLVWDHFGSGKRNGKILQVDHIDENKLNNRIDNLQLLSPRENVYKHHKQFHKFIGVYQQGDKYRSRIYKNGKTKHLGCFNNEYDAHLAYQKEKIING